MIFVTVGTTSFPFDRLLRAVDEAMSDPRKGEELVVQQGVSKYQFKYPKTKTFKELPFDKIISYMKKARMVITHGGPATIFLVLKYCKNKPLVVPRTKKYGEHVDNHELFFAKFLEKKGEIEASFPEEDLPLKIGKYFCQPVKSIAGRENVASRELIKKLIEYTNLLK